MDHQETDDAQAYNQKHKGKKIEHKQNATDDKTGYAMCMVNLIVSYEKIDDAIKK